MAAKQVLVLCVMFKAGHVYVVGHEGLQIVSTTPEPARCSQLPCENREAGLAQH